MHPSSVLFRFVPPDYLYVLQMHDVKNGRGGSQTHPMGLNLESSSLLLAFLNHKDTKNTKFFLFGLGRKGRRYGRVFS